MLVESEDNRGQARTGAGWSVMQTSKILSEYKRQEMESDFDGTIPSNTLEFEDIGDIESMAASEGEDDLEKKGAENAFSAESEWEAGKSQFQGIKNLYTKSSSSTKTRLESTKSSISNDDLDESFDEESKNYAINEVE
ncbi:hypothetical protein BC936DRAFT_147346 [Jimgerdemannia flammicorona]|uniref:Uncharacterized protein n=1 Tax=Jimgerdemannia flammicorona TaxID=994334 RepID=A0A433D5M2_9FUNG|nr:hypothetical protein BC936DRAFT_147346 [Jimgerdemannia flammicorona]